jgi:hypothetical protein
MITIKSRDFVMNRLLEMADISAVSLAIGFGFSVLTVRERSTMQNARYMIPET